MRRYAKAVINGEFFCADPSGIERFALEMTKRLDMISEKNEIGIVIPANARNVPQFSNIEIIEYPKNIKSRPIWQQFVLPRLLSRINALCIDFGNATSLFYPGITFLHDIYCELFPEDFITKKEKYNRFYFRILYRIIAWRAKKIITVSDFCRKQIAKAFCMDGQKISVLYPSWEHFAAVTPDYSIFEAYPELSKPYYFSLGSLSKRKNMKWIVEYAAKHPDETFVISGQSLLTMHAVELEQGRPENVLLPGYLSDSQVKALMERCKAFILPSYYEGFGLTPLEALACGAKIIVSRSASLPEVYGKSAYYIDPFDVNVDLDALLLSKVGAPENTLKKYSYDTSAQGLYAIIREYIRA